MGQITDLATAQKLLLQGKGVATPYSTIAQGATTNVIAGGGAGFLAGGISTNSIGTTLPSTLQSLLTPPGITTAQRMVLHVHSHSAATQGWLGWFYKLGTLNLAATGDQFTHDTATFPALRTMYGASNQPVSLTPLIQVTTATTNTQAVFTIKNGAGSNGYVDDDGNTVVGTRTFTMPAAATATNSTYHLILEDTDGGVRDITNINVGTAASAGAATIWGFERLAPMGELNIAISQTQDTITGGLCLPNLTPAVATTGTITAVLGTLNIDNASRSSIGMFLGALDT